MCRVVGVDETDDVVDKTRFRFGVIAARSGHGEGHRVCAGDRVRVCRVLLGARRAVAEAPGPARDVSRALVDEFHHRPVGPHAARRGELGAKRRGRANRYQSRLRLRVRGTRAVGDLECHRVRAGR